MSRSGYDDCMGSEWGLICWRGAVNSAMKGKRGQAFLKEMLAAIDAMPNKRLSHGFADQGTVCALGSIAQARGIDVSDIDSDDPDARYPIAQRLGIAPAMAAEIMFENDESYYYGDETPEHRYTRMREWVRSQIR